MSALSPADSARLARVEKEAHYGLTLKDLLWLVKLARRLEQQLSKQKGADRREHFKPSAPRDLILPKPTKAPKAKEK